jgi:cell pole-organizing protein PopZ
MLRPMLREWLDAHLPELVEQMVAREIARITSQAG